jgi:hypothetical protein
MAGKGKNLCQHLTIRLILVQRETGNFTSHGFLTTSKKSRKELFKAKSRHNL